WLVLRLGHLPGFYATKRPAELRILGRTVKLQPHQYTVVWYESQLPRTAYRTDSDFYYVPVRQVARTSHDGYVYNLETDGPHTYLANQDRKSTRLNSSHVAISYAVFCLK